MIGWISRAFTLAMTVLFAVFFMSSFALGGDGKAEIRLAAMNDPFAFVIEQILPEFTRETQIEVSLDFFSYEDLYLAATSDFIEKTGKYDLVTMDIVWIGEWAESGFILPLSDLARSHRLDTEAFSPVAFAGLGCWEDRLYAIPVAGYYFLFHYRKDLFDRHNLSAPVTFSDIFKAGLTLTSAETDLFGIAVPMVRDAPLVHFSLAYLAGAGGNLEREDNFKGICDNTAIEVFSHYGRFGQIGPPDMLSFDWFSTTDSYLTGKLAMLGAWSVVSNMFENKSESQVAGKTGYTTLPVLEKGQTGKTPFGGWSLAINKNSSRKDAAWKFMQWMVRPDVHYRYTEKSGTPVLLSCLTDPELQKQRPWFKLVHELEKSKRVDPYFRPRIAHWPRMEEILGSMLHAAYSGETDLKTALEKSAEMLEALVK